MMLAGKMCSSHRGELVGGSGGDGVGGGARDGHAIPGPHQVDRAQSEEQRHGGDDFEIEDGLGADAAHVLEVAAAGDAGHQRGEQQGRDDGADQAQEDVAHRAELVGEIRREDAQRHAGGHADEDPGGQREPLHRSPHLSFWRSTSKNIMRGGRIRSSEWCELRHTITSRSRMGSAHLAIDGEVDALVGAARNHADDAGFGHQDGPVGEHVRADGREADGGHGGENDGSAGGERIRGGAGGRGDDQPVGFVGADELLVHVSVQIDHARDGGSW